MSGNAQSSSSNRLGPDGFTDLRKGSYVYDGSKERVDNLIVYVRPDNSHRLDPVVEGTHGVDAVFGELKTDSRILFS